MLILLDRAFWKSLWGSKVIACAGTINMQICIELALVFTTVYLLYYQSRVMSCEWGSACVFKVMRWSCKEPPSHLSDFRCDVFVRDVLFFTVEATEGSSFTPGSHTSPGGSVTCRSGVVGVVNWPYKSNIQYVIKTCLTSEAFKWFTKCEKKY